MQVTGIICEYNPFHNGHKKQLDEIKNSVEDAAIVCIMSGDFVQRGEVSLLDKYKRAGLALKNGADLVVELPSRYVLSSAEGFAYGGISLLSQMVVVDQLSFGANHTDPSLYKKASLLLNNEDSSFQETLTQALSKGDSYPKARELALKNALIREGTDSKTIDSFLHSPNDQLGLEYQKAIDSLNSSIEIKPFHRVGADHFDQKIVDSTASGSYIRKQILENHSLKGLTGVLPQDTQKVLQDGLDHKTLLSSKDLSLPLNYQLMQLFSSYGSASDLSFDLTNDSPMEGQAKSSRKILQEIIGDSKTDQELMSRLLRVYLSYPDFSELAEQVKSKNVTHSHITRLFCRILLQQLSHPMDEKKRMVYISPGYLHVLGFTDLGKVLLGRIRKESNLPIIVNPASDGRLLDPKQRVLLDEDIEASNLARLLRQKNSGIPEVPEVSRSFIPIP
ncbi:MAG TPA: hypothetical protein DCY73_03830 [Lachnospiraceae bacterium]|nr:hypothetical protein [Lachnospiraceae bacterium]